MAVRVQVILDEEEAQEFRIQAKKEATSLSQWLRESGRERLLARKGLGKAKMTSKLSKFFKECKQREKGQEPDWETYKELIAGEKKGRHNS